MTFNYWPKGSSVAQTVKCNGNDVGSLEIISDIWYSYLSFLFVILSASAQSEERCEILLGPEITYGPPGLNLSYPVAMTIAHCAEVSAENWNIKLKRQTKDNKWEVGTKTWILQFFFFLQQIHLKFFQYDS